MYFTQAIYAMLFDRLYSYRYEGSRVINDVLNPWLKKARDERTWLGKFKRRLGKPFPPAEDEELCRLYALSRIADVCRTLDWRGVKLSQGVYENFFQKLGFSVVQHPYFHPFYHEIVSVEQTADDDVPIEVTNIFWNALMLGNMMFARARVAVRGGRNHIVKEIAEQSTLYWAYYRTNRDHEDLSHGWGPNSQWRTRFRRDYHIKNWYIYNVDEINKPMGIDLNKETLTLSLLAEDSLLSLATIPERIELLVNRCFIKCTLDSSDLFPYWDFYKEKE